METALIFGLMGAGGFILANQVSAKSSAPNDNLPAADQDPRREAPDPRDDRGQEVQPLPGTPPPNRLSMGLNDPSNTTPGGVPKNPAPTGDSGETSSVVDAFRDRLANPAGAFGGGGTKDDAEKDETRIIEGFQPISGYTFSVDRTCSTCSGTKLNAATREASATIPDFVI